MFREWRFPLKMVIKANFKLTAKKSLSQKLRDKNFNI